MRLDEITLCFDMHGCPNRCLHCWLGITPNGNMPVSFLEDTAENFRSFTDCLQIYDWYREPDYRDNYREMFELCGELSDKPPEHFELVSFWRLVRDKEYVRWLSSVGVKNAQLTIFGDEETTDRYVGRKGAYREILSSLEILMENRITPRIQAFVNKDNIDMLPHIEEIIKEFELEKRCREFGGEFAFFLHQGSCDGENEKLYDLRITPDDMAKIPPLLEKYTLKHFGKGSMAEVLGRAEQELYEELLSDRSKTSYVSRRPVFYIDKDYNVYPNITAPSAYWRLGNIKTHSAKEVLENYIVSKSPAQHTALTVPVCDTVRACGDSSSLRLFSRGDYILFMLNKFCRINAL